jgi:protoporphyrinogen oxidase
MERRQFLKWLMLTSGAAASGLSACKPKRVLGGKIVGANANLGHRLRDEEFIFPEIFEDYKVAIVGGGISGLSAAYHLSELGVEDLVCLELESDLGGNARAGSNQFSKYPFGAHYVPLPNTDLVEYLNFLSKADVLKGYEQELPIYNEAYLCHMPQERLYISGKWQDGIVPHHGVSKEDLLVFEVFFQKIAVLRQARGNDGKYAFAIPVDRSSDDLRFRNLDSITFSAWLQQNGFDIPALLWYTNYCTLDDFGTDINTISAWAGLHYFASRRGTAHNAGSDDVLTWEEGNAFLAQKLREHSNSKYETDAMVVGIRNEKESVLIAYLDGKTNTIKGIRCSQCIVASPQFVNAKILKGVDARRAVVTKDNLNYSTWIVANMQVDGPLDERQGVEMSWDNVIYNGSGLGYINANHQQISLNQNQLNLTYYKPINTNQSVVARREALNKSHAQWVAEVIGDLSLVHPNLENKLRSMDVAVWGHAMVQPLPDWIWGSARANLKESIGSNIHFAHTDIAGLSIFEEGFYQGLSAAKKVVRNL